ncbi:hypothetical protein GGF46_005270 [Coemansia sp. RSA 552]|nr:hypothetical protein GGF46_005270 [Coemansia sp. RSA 552]
MAARIRVSNISKHVETGHLERLFGFIGTLVGIDMAPESAGEAREALVEFSDAEDARAALVLGGVELADRALVITEERRVAVPGVMRSGSSHALPLSNPAVVAQLGQRRTKSLAGLAPHILALIPAQILQTDPIKAEEISRTVYAGNISASVSEQELMDVFGGCGPVAYVKMAGDGLQPTRFAFVEFGDVETAQRALLMNGVVVGDRALKVNHSKNAINKPVAGPVVVGPRPMAPTLAAMASLPSTAAAPLSSGIAWPLLGVQKPLDGVDQKLRELREKMEDKYETGVESRRTGTETGVESRSGGADRAVRNATGAIAEPPL